MYIVPACYYNNDNEHGKCDIFYTLCYDLFGI